MECMGQRNQMLQIHNDWLFIVVADVCVRV